MAASKRLGLKVEYSPFKEYDKPASRIETSTPVLLKLPPSGATETKAPAEPVPVPKDPVPKSSPEVKTEHLPWPPDMEGIPLRECQSKPQRIYDHGLFVKTIKKASKELQRNGKSVKALLRAAKEGQPRPYLAFQAEIDDLAELRSYTLELATQVTVSQHRKISRSQRGVIYHFIDGAREFFSRFHIQSALLREHM